MIETPPPSQPPSASYRLAEIWQFPVKGLPGQRYDRVPATPGELLPDDRRFAVSNGHPSSHHKLADGWLSKRHFVQLLSEARLAGLLLSVDEANGLISLSDGSGLRSTAPLEDAGPVMAELNALLPDRFEAPPRLCRLNDGGYTDTDAPWISLGGTASLADFGTVTQTPPDNRRFRLNLVIRTNTPFEELSWVGKTLRIGAVVLDIMAPVGRCAAINVDPRTAQRGDDYLQTMRHIYGHTNLGVFARVTNAGTLTCDEVVSVLD